MGQSAPPSPPLAMPLGTTTHMLSPRSLTITSPSAMGPLPFTFKTLLKGVTKYSLKLKIALSIHRSLADYFQTVRYFFPCILWSPLDFDVFIFNFADVRERYHNVVLLFFVLLRNMAQFSWNLGRYERLLFLKYVTRSWEMSHLSKIFNFEISTPL